MLCMLALALATGQATPLAGPDFSASSIEIAPVDPAEGDLVTLTLNIRNTGGEAATHAEVDLQLPRGGMFVDAGPDVTAIDLDARVVSWQAAIDAGASRSLTVRLIVPRDAGGEALLPTLRARQLYTGTEAWIHGEADIQTRPNASAVSAFGLGFAPAGLALIALLFAAAVTWIVLRVRTGASRTSAVIAIAIPVGCWMLFASMAWHDWRVLSEFVASECQVLDRRLRFSVTPSSTTRSLPQQPRTTTTYRPLLAVRYEVDGQSTISTGFDTGSRVQIGRGAREIESFERWQIGSTVPCWYDPRDPAAVVVVRGFGGAYFFALIPIPLFLIGVWLVRKRSRASLQVR